MKAQIIIIKIKICINTSDIFDEKNKKKNL